jgi:hypothetical protein
VTALVLVPLGFVSMFSVYQPWDDEGYFLFTLRDYMAGHAAYSQVYGPFFYQVMGGVFQIFGLSVSTDNGRIVTLVVWMLASLIGGITVLALTRNLWLGIAGQLLTFHALSALTHEPMHPEGLTGLLLVSLTALAAGRPRFPRASALLIGALVAAITLVKINVGVFAALAVAVAFAAALNGHWRRVLLPATVLALVASPFLLTAGLFGFAWARELALMVSLSAAAVGVAGFAAKPPQFGRSEAVLLIAGGAALTIACLAIAAVGGMRPADLVDSVTGALKFPQLFVLPAVVGIPHVLWAALSLAVVGEILWRRFGARASPAIPAFLRIGVGAFTALSVLLLPLWWFMLAFPLAWVAVLPPAGDTENPTDPTARLLLAALAVIDCLYLYPVAGTQQWVAALPLVPVSAITFNDGLRQLRAWAATRQSRSFLKVAASLAPGALIVTVAAWPVFIFFAGSAYASGQPLGLPGTELMRLPPAQVSDLQSLARAIDQNCTNLITLPRLPSLYLWTGRPGPSQLNSGIWVFSLDASQQQSIVSEIRDQPGLCVVRSQAELDFWAQGRQIPDRPLVEYIDTAFEPAGKFGIYELLVRKPQ